MRAQHNAVTNKVVKETNATVVQKGKIKVQILKDVQTFSNGVWGFLTCNKFRAFVNNKKNKTLKA